MILLLKNTQALIGSLISTIVDSIITQIKPVNQGIISIKYHVLGIKWFCICAFFCLILNTSYLIPDAYAISDPTSITNNKFGIHIISPTPQELTEAQTLVNSAGGDWGYITFVIEDKDQNVDKWQRFFNELRSRHLIPIVRLATHPVGDSWAVPDDDSPKKWSEFLAQLNWPIKNRYIMIYNEPNHGAEWGGIVDPAKYAQILNQTIEELKKQSPDFFVLNAGFDASTPQKPPAYMDEITFIEQMEKEVPGIFEKLDGWVSHSYPNPGFIGSPDAQGRGTVRTWFWELQKLRDLGVKKNLPVFITETGWKHAEGISYNPSLPSTHKVADYFKTAFETAWNSDRIVTVTPFILNYQQPPFDHFSFKKVTGEKQDARILGAQYQQGEDTPDYHAQYTTIKALPKVAGKPQQEHKAILTKGEVYTSLVAEQSYKIQLTFKNTGQSIWNDTNTEVITLKPIQGEKELGMIITNLPKDTKIEPNQEYIFNIEYKAPKTGKYQVVLNLFQGATPFQTDPVEFDTEVKSPVIIEVKSSLKWKDNFAGKYLLSIVGPISEILSFSLTPEGVSQNIETRELLPDYSYDFTLSRPFYHPKTITQTLQSGVNILDFGILEPDLISVLFKPKELWELLPWSDK